MPKALLAFSVNADGTLTALTGSPFDVGDGPVSVVVDASGRFLYAAGDSVYGLYLDSLNGTLTSMAAPFGPAGYAWLYPEVTGSFLLRGDPSGISLYRIDPSTGGLTVTSSRAVPGGAGTGSCAVNYTLE
jgi:6-phosphogluconolactonase (cycloisomerase 2 family)